jgi:hypothetical protein
LGATQALGHEVAMQRSANDAILDIINLFLGAFLFFSPWLFSYAAGAMSGAAWISGLLIFLASIAALAAFAEWEEWANLLLGIWVFVSPWVLGFDGSQAMHINLVVGIIVAMLATIELWSDHPSPPQVSA